MKGRDGCQVGNQQSPCTLLPDTHYCEYRTHPSEASFPWWISKPAQKNTFASQSNQPNEDTSDFFPFPSFLLPILPPLDTFLFGQALLTLRSGIISPSSSTCHHGLLHRGVCSEEKESICLFHSLQRGLKAEFLVHGVSRNS